MSTEQQTPVENKQEKLKGLLKGRLSVMSMRRKNKIVQHAFYEKECKKAGIDPEKFMEMMKKNNK